MTASSPDPFDARRRGFEEEYFRTRDAELVDKLKTVFRSKLDREELRKTTGITSDEVLDRLVKAHVRGELLTVFQLYPLVEIAWADGTVDPREAEAIVAAALKFGIPADGEAIARLREWIARGPTEDGRAAWRMFAGELRKTLTPQQLETFRTDLVGFAQSVAEASGGILGVAFKISHTEQRVIDTLTRQLTPA